MSIAWCLDQRGQCWQLIANLLTLTAVGGYFVGCRNTDYETTVAPEASRSDTDSPNAPPDDRLTPPVLVLGQTNASIDEQQLALDPQQDGWDTEVLSAAANQQLAALARLMESAADVPAKELRPIVATDFVSGPLRPQELREVFRSTTLIVRRGKTPVGREKLETFTGVQGMRTSLTALLLALEATADVHVKFKQFRISRTGEDLSTTAYYHSSGKTENGHREQNATWHCRWRLDCNDMSPQLVRIDVLDYEEAETHRAKEPLFADCTEAVLGKTAVYRRQLSYGIPYWRQRIAVNLELQYHGHHGLALGDINEDGLDDVYVCQPGGLTNALLVQQADGSARDIAKAAGVDILNETRSALLIDLDNDGDQDIVIATTEQLLLFENSGKGQFTRRVRFASIRTAYSLAAADFDNDGDLDVYVCRYFNADDGGFPAPYPFHDANNGGRNTLLRNDGAWNFTDATASSGLDVDNRRFSFAASWEDYDNDGDQDLYVANDFGRNCLYRNDGGRFVSAAGDTGLEDTAFGMSVSWGDPNLDGHMDIYVGNMFSAAGNRITFQHQFKQELSEEAKKTIQRTARGNSLFQSTGDGSFQDVSNTERVTMGRWSWSSLFVDLNNDGWQDLVVTNGNITGNQTNDL